MSTAPSQSPSDRDTAQMFAALSPYNLAALFLIIFILGLGAAYVIDATKPVTIEPQRSVYRPPLVATTIAGAEMVIPAAWLKGSESLSGTFVDEANLNLMVSFDGLEGPRPISVMFTPLSHTRPSEYLLDKVYLHQFEERQVGGISGLIGKPLVARDGFESETVWYDAISPQPFVAKCIAVAQDSHQQCMRTVKGKNSLAITFQFSSELLSNWKSFDAVLNPYLEQIGAK